MNTPYQNVLLGIQARQRMNAMRGYSDQYDSYSSYGSDTTKKKTSGMNQALSSLSNLFSSSGSSANSSPFSESGGSLGSGSGFTAALPWVALGAAARNAFEKDTIGGTWGEASRRLDPFTGVSSGNLLKEAWSNPLKIVDPSSGGTRVFSAIRTVIPNLPKDPSERLFNAVKKIF